MKVSLGGSHRSRWSRRALPRSPPRWRPPARSPVVRRHQERRHAHDRARRGARRARPDARAHVRRPHRLPAHVREALRPRLASSTSSRSSRPRCRRSRRTSSPTRSSSAPAIKFNDGTAFNAAAVKTTLDRDLTLEGLGARERDLADQLGRRPSATTVVLHLKSPYSPLTAQLADRAGMILSPKALDARAASSRRTRSASARSCSRTASPATTSR